ncbi:MAG: hypothetical protein JWM33_1618 [Caulobacteraceae bacterium]|nr:hypothetical protein [Caulobacteraceae bacterium]
MSARYAPVLALFFLSPLVAEYLLGSLPMSMIGILPIMAAMYGSAALLIREIAKRTGGSWQTIALLGLAYGLIEEGLIDQSLFNPHYLGLRLLDYGHVAALGTGLPWLIYVLTIHVVWSIGVPIGLTEALFPARRAQSWLGPIGLAVFTLLFLAAAAAIAGFTYGSEHFLASPAQLIGAAIAAALAVVAAIGLKHPRRLGDGQAEPAAWLIFILAMLAGSATMACRYFAPAWHWPWPLCVAAQLIIGALFLIFARRVRRWTDRQSLALVLGGLAVYGAFGFLTDLTLHGTAVLLPHLGIVALFMVIAVIAAWQTLRVRGAALAHGG